MASQRASTKIIDALLSANAGDVLIRGTLGSGPHARRLPEGDWQTYKVLLPGDTAGIAIDTLYFLLWDLAIDLGLPEDIRGDLAQELSQRGG